MLNFTKLKSQIARFAGATLSFPYFFGALAQSVERNNGIVEANGSNPLRSNSPLTSVTSASVFFEVIAFKDISTPRVLFFN